MKYQIVVMWNAMYPELNPHVHENLGRMMNQAVRVRDMEGPEHPLWYLMWEPGKVDAVGLYPIPEALIDQWR